MKNIVYLALNDAQYAREAVASMSSLRRAARGGLKGYRFVVYTNLPRAFDGWAAQDSGIETVQAECQKQLDAFLGK